jgi:hypothetical protein
MPRFVYTARERQGTNVSGGIDAQDKAEAVRKIEAMGCTPISVTCRDTVGSGNTIATLGQKYSTSLLAGQGFSQTSLVLTARTLSGVGKTYSAKSKGIISFAGDVKNVSSIGLEYTSNWIYLLLGILTLPAYGLGILFLIVYFVTKERYVVVNFQGALYALSLRGISNADAQAFMEKVLSTGAAAG